MKKLFRFFISKQPRELKECTSFAINKNESDKLFGGFREYTPPIYEKDTSTDRSFKTSELLVDINQIKK